MLTVTAWLLLIAVAVPNVVIVVELLAGARPRPLVLVPPPLSLANAPMPETIVLVPAHDEAAGIEAMLGRTIPLLPARARILVVADNCTDDTALRARAAGAQVTERHDPVRRGKGHALAHGRAHIAAGLPAGVPAVPVPAVPVANIPAVVIVLDADCVPEAGALERLARGAATTGRPVQASYLIEPSPTGSPMIQISGFAFLVKNLVRQAGLARIGAPAVLTGSGMAFPWAAFVAAPLATDDIVEDLAIGIALSRIGLTPRFDPAARIWTPPAGQGGTLGQRTRWEHGFVQTARRVALPLVMEGLRRGRPGLSWLGLHVAVPPLALLLALDAAVLLLIALAVIFGGSVVPLVIAMALIGSVGLAVLLAWARFGREQVGPGALIRAPLYLLWKLPIYLKLVRKAETQWIRTDRGGGD